MARLFIRYLKPYLLTALAIICLLFVQAGLNLLLPDYMSNIVDNGIQNNGITDASLVALSTEQYDELTLFIEESSLATINESYTYIEPGDMKYIDQYPYLHDNGLFLLNNTADKKLISSIWFQPLLFTSLLDSGRLDTSLLAVGFESGFYLHLTTLTPAERIVVVEQLSAQLDEDTIAASQLLVINAVKEQYQAIDIPLQQAQKEYIFSIGTKMLLVSLLAAISAVLISLLTSRMTAGVSQTLRRDIFEKVANFSQAEFNEFSTASLITRATNDVTQVQGLITMFFRIFLFSPIIGIGALINVLRSDVDMLWIIGIGIAFIVFLLILMFIFVLPKFKKIQKLIDRVNLVARESLNGLLVVRAFSSEKYEEERFDEANRGLAKIQLFVTRTIALMFPTMNLAMNILTMMIIWFGSFQVASGNIQIGVMMAFVQYTMHVLMSFLIIAASFIVIPRASVSAVRIMAVLDAPLSITDPVEPQSFLPAHKGEVVFEQVFFRYPNAEEDTLSDISFVAKPGETTAVIGGTGSGKSTLISLILRLHDVSDGQLLVNGTDVKDVKQHDLREKIGYIPQKAVLFSGTIDSNLRYGKENASRKEMKKAVEIAQAADVIAEKEAGYDEPIAQAGTNVSGGQKQRLSIARALLKPADIFLFDDSFSALDFKTDAALRAALRQQLADKTIIIVTQRIGTVMDAEQIIVLEDGKIVGKGTHQQLLKNCEVYRELALSQLSKKELAL